MPLWAVMLVAAPARADEPISPYDEAAPAPAGDPAWELYDAAFVRLAASDLRGARALLEELRRDHPTHPAAQQAATRLGQMGEVVEETRRPPSDREPTQLGRAELVLGATLHSMYLASNLCDRFECEGNREHTGVYMLTGASALGVSLLATRRGAATAQAQLIDSAMLWGAWNSIWIIADIEYDEDWSPEKEADIRLVAHLGGLGVGLGLWPLWRPTSGQVALANSAGIWTFVLTAFAYGASGEDNLDGTTLALATDVGLVLGALIGEGIPEISRGRSLIIDAGGILGMLAGALIGAASNSDDFDDSFAPLMLGTAAGLGIAAYATRDWDVPAPSGVRLTAMPVGHGGWGAGLHLDWP